jgi:hypothetical protein
MATTPIEQRFRHPDQRPSSDRPRPADVNHLGTLPTATATTSDHPTRRSVRLAPQPPRTEYRVQARPAGHSSQSTRFQSSGRVKAPPGGRAHGCTRLARATKRISSPHMPRRPTGPVVRASAATGQTPVSRCGSRRLQVRDPAAARARAARPRAPAIGLLRIKLCVPARPMCVRCVYCMERIVK